MKRISLLLTILLAAPASLLAQVDMAEASADVMALAKLTDAPTIRDANGAELAVKPGLQAIFFDALDYEGKPTRVFAWLGIPEAADPVPGMVLVHGGGGTAFKDWVVKWNERGVAAISIAVEGQIDKKPKPGQKGHWQAHDWPGPVRVGIYGDSDKPLKQQWMYHAVADTILANSLLRSLTQVDADKVGLMGISWGGIITSTTIGIDPRFAFAIPTYGCGDLSSAANQYGRALGKNEIYKQVWDPMVRIKNVKMPVQWLSWPKDKHFPLDKQASCYRATPGEHMVTLIPGMGHGHGAAWNPPDSYIFAKNAIEMKRPWSVQTGSTLKGDQFTATFDSPAKFTAASLISTTDTGITGERDWAETPATVEKTGPKTWVVTATIPAGSTAWFTNAKHGHLTVSSDYQER